jgi:hypothetical protein
MAEALLSTAFGTADRKPDESRPRYSVIAIPAAM